MSGILDGLSLLVEPSSLLMVVLGLLIGFAGGLFPGLNASALAALVLTFSLSLSVEGALILMVSLYAGELFAGSVPAILLGVAGTPGAAVTLLDGFPMAQRGEARLAIGISRMASVVGGVVGTIVVIALIGPFGDVALYFGSREMFAVAILGLFIIGTVVGSNPAKGLLAGVVGMLCATVGLDPITSQPRLTLGMIELYDGLPLVAVLVGVFAVSQLLVMASAERQVATTLPEPALPAHGVTSQGSTMVASRRGVLAEISDGIRTTLRYPRLLTQSTAVGLLVGILPGAGSAVAGYASYGFAKKTSKHPETFGTGNPEGIIAAEAADGGNTSGTLVPTFALGVPGSGTGAVMLAALYLHGVVPGPQVMETHRPEVYAVLLGLLLASILILPLGIALATPMTYIVKLKPGVVVPPVLVLCFVGAIALRSSYFDVGILIVFAFIGCLLKYCGYPVVPLVLGLVLGPLAEDNFSRSLLLGQGHISYFFQSPVAIVLWLIIAALIAGAIRKTLLKRRAVV
jgi:putative tricarboxylic transport membrane protein